MGMFALYQAIILFTQNLEFFPYSEVMQYMEVHHSSERKYNKD